MRIREPSSIARMRIAETLKRDSARDIVGGGGPAVAKAGERWSSAYPAAGGGAGGGDGELKAVSSALA